MASYCFFVFPSTIQTNLVEMASASYKVSLFVPLQLSQHERKRPRRNGVLIFFCSSKVQTLNVKETLFSR